MKKSLLVSTLAAFMALGLVGCTGTGASSSSSATPSVTPSTSVPTADIPVAEGKTSLWFTLGDDSAIKELKSWNSFFMVGSFNGWDTAKAAEFKNISGTKNYYTQIDTTSISKEDGSFDVTKEGFQLTIGWNASSGAPAAKQGADYTFKSDYCALYTDGTSHPLFGTPADSKLEIVGATKVVSNPSPITDSADEKYMADTASIVHYQTFSKQKASPVKIDDYKMKFKIADKDSKGTAKPTWVSDFYATGSYDSWGGSVTDAYKLTKDAQGYYSITFGTVYADVTVEFMIVCTIKNSVGEVVPMGFWTYKLQAANLTWTPGTADEGVGEPDDYVWTEWPADPGSAVAVTMNLTVTDFPSDAKYTGGISVKGAFDGWSEHAMTKDTTSGVWSYTYPLVTPAADIEFGFNEYTKIDDADSAKHWFAAASGNAKITIEAACTVTVTGTIAGGIAGVIAA